MRDSDFRPFITCAITALRATRIVKLDGRAGFTLRGAAVFDAQAVLCGGRVWVAGVRDSC